MLGTWIQSGLASIPSEFAIFLGISLLISASGFYRLVYFVSLGYAFSVMAMAVVAIILFWGSLGFFTALQCVMLAAYGLRLGSYLLRRELQTSYGKEMEAVRAREVGVTVGRKVLIWLAVSLLYVLMFSPSLFNLDTQREMGSSFRPVLLPVGIAVMIVGLGLEAIADWQKSAYKQQFPDQFCNVGLYRWVRCPNYLGEIIFWLGNWVAAFGAYTSWLRWGFGLAGLVCIVLIMIGSTKRLEQKQKQRYGSLPKFQEYTQSVPVLIPFVPIYTLERIRVYLE